MSEISGSRLVSFEILSAYKPGSSNLSELVSARLNRAGKRLEHKGFSRELVFGSVRYLNTIDYIIDLLNNTRNSIEMPVRNILRLGIFQVYFQEGKPPDYASVDGCVEIAKGSGFLKASGFVNAILRESIRKKAEIRNQIDSSGDLSLLYAHPGWFVRKLLSDCSAAETKSILKANNDPAPFSIRAAVNKISRQELSERLLKEGVETEISKYSPDGLILKTKPELETLVSFREGLFDIQDEASQLISRIVDPKENETILDMCSGSGTKTLHLMHLAQNRLSIIAVDLSKHKLEALSARVQARFGSEIRVVNKDARHISGISADKVLLDAPCSGFGVLRKKPDIKWNRSLKDIEERLPAMQYEILCNAAKLVKPGGVIIYSTCTIFNEENELVVDKFLAAHDNFKLGNIVLAGTESKYFKTLTYRDGMDGFFAAKIIRIR